MSSRNLSVFFVMFVTTLLFLTPGDAEARYGYYGHYGYRHHGYGYHRPYYGYGHSYRHRGYYSGYRGHGYGYRRHHGSSHSPLYKLLSIPAHVAYGVLKIPAYVVGGLTGSYSGGYSGPYRNDDSGADVPATDYNGDSDNSTEGPSATDSSNGSTTGNATPIPRNDAGWAALARGDDRAALQHFSQMAMANPRQGIPKVGYALAAAGAGDLDRGSWAMRRALRYDAESLHYLQVSDGLSARLDTLVTHYQDRLVNQGNNSNTVAMLGALHYLQGDRESARQVLAGFEYIGSDESLAGLDRLLQVSEEELTNEEPVSPPIIREGNAIADRQQ